jgi:hypothetical protein
LYDLPLATEVSEATILNFISPTLLRELSFEMSSTDSRRFKTTRVCRIGEPERSKMQESIALKQSELDGLIDDYY